jgi:hypothetical protein
VKYLKKCDDFSVVPQAIMANSDKFLVVFYAASAGQNGPELGSDEEEIVLLVYWVIDLHSNQVRDTKQRCSN